MKHPSTASITSVALTGYDGEIIDVETDMRTGLPGLQIVGMGNKAIDEARQRVKSAVSNSLLEFPARKITINLAPAELPKDGTHLDLPIAISILVAAGQINSSEVADSAFAGELALNGSLRPIRGALIITEAARKAGLKRVFIPSQNVSQAVLVGNIRIIGVSTLLELFKHLRGIKSLPRASPSSITPPATPRTSIFSSVVGNEQAKRALTIAIAGRHNILFTGPPGTGKTLLAKAAVELLPPLTHSEIVAVTKLHSLSNATVEINNKPPLRAPHHSVTLTALIGGGFKPRPGDVSLAHKGILFLDELPEYPRASLEALRQPLEDRKITLSRLHGHITYPADVMLVATMNPCPCGYLGDKSTVCTCTAGQISAYKHKISGPLLDRIDLRVAISKISTEQIFETKSLSNYQRLEVLNSIMYARSMQKQRYNRSSIYNAYASFDDVKALFSISDDAQSLLHKASKKLQLSNRASLRVVRVARTIADIDQSASLEATHIAEALQYRGSSP